MSGTRSGGLKARETNYKRYGKDHYRKIGQIGGQIGGRKTGIKKGFALNPELASSAGRKGGKISKRGKAKHEQER